MRFYHDLITQKSFAELKQLQKTADFILIGGWAVYFYTHQLKSKDIDIILNYDQLSKLAAHYALTKNERLQKYEARKDEVQIDLYLPHYSDLGIPVEELLKHTAGIEGFVLLQANYLATLKIHTFNQRRLNPKGRKDFLDLVSLLASPWPEIKQIKTILAQYKIDHKLFLAALKTTTQIPELNLNPHQLSRLKNQFLKSF
ncbi:MAG: hypothetical protein ABH807_02425 [Candidatus Shapirobacteria bacterium]